MGNLGVLEYRADEAGEIVFALVAAKTTVGAADAMVVAAVRADHVITPPRLDESLLAGLFVNEVVCDGYERVEHGEVNHGKIV